MGKKIFVSYKYSDSKVKALNGVYGTTTVRHYVDKLQNKLDFSDHIYKGENDNEDIGSLADSTIGSKLGDKIFNSTVTIVLISKGMRETYKAEKDQWIPWEISYSLKEQSRNGQRSKTNAVLGVILPDTSGSYSWYDYNPNLFSIIKENMNNKKTFGGEPSYIKTVKWENFIGNINLYVEKAVDIWRIRDQYNIKKTV